MKKRKHEQENGFYLGLEVETAYDFYLRSIIVRSFFTFTTQLSAILTKESLHIVGYR